MIRDNTALLRFSEGGERPGKEGGGIPGTETTPEERVLVGYRPTALVPSLHRSE